MLQEHCCDSIKTAIVIPAGQRMMRSIALEVTHKQHHIITKGMVLMRETQLVALPLTKGTNHSWEGCHFVQVTPKHPCRTSHTTLYVIPLAAGSAMSWPVPVSQLSDQATFLICCNDLDLCSTTGPRTPSCFPHPCPPFPSTSTIFPMHGHPNAGVIPKLPRIHMMPLRGLLKSDAPI